MKKVFLDTAYAIALSAVNDQHHEAATILAEEIEKQNWQIVTTRAVLIEIGNALSKQRYRKAGLALLEALEEDPTVDIIPVTEELYATAYQLYSARLDKEWGLTDCISFVVMAENGITEALTTDEHFVQAGFRAMLD